MLKRFYGNIQAVCNRALKNRHVKATLPFFVFMAIGLVLIRECATVRYQFRKTRTLTREDMERLGYKVNEIPQTLEQMYEEYQKIDIDNWENVRGPRLFDETPSN